MYFLASLISFAIYSLRWGWGVKPEALAQKSKVLALAYKVLSGMGPFSILLSTVLFLSSWLFGWPFLLLSLLGLPRVNALSKS